jgi:hypothetical protein
VWSLLISNKTHEFQNNGNFGINGTVEQSKGTQKCEINLNHLDGAPLTFLSSELGRTIAIADTICVLLREATC